MGLIHQLDKDDVAKYRERRELSFGTNGKVVLRYFVLNSTVSDVSYYTTAEQALTLTLNGQRQHTKPRAWLKAKTQLNYLAERLIVVADCTGLTNRARREVFSSTRESAADTPLTKEILGKVSTIGLKRVHAHRLGLNADPHVSPKIHGPQIEAARAREDTYYRDRRIWS